MDHAGQLETEAAEFARHGDHGTAAGLFARATASDPRRASAWLGLGRALAALGQADEADKAFLHYFALAPVQAAIAEAAERQQKGEIDTAISLYRQILERAPKNVDALRLLGIALVQQGKFDEAEDAIRRALALAPDFVFAWNNLGSILNEMDRLPEAIAAFRRAIALAPDEIQSHYNLGNALAANGDHEAALEAYDRTLAVWPGHPGCLIGKGHVLKTIGRQAEAVAAYRECVAGKCDYGEVWWSLANLKTYRFSDDEIVAMKSVLAQSEMSAESEASVLFGLGKAYEDRAQYDTAFDYYARGNRVRRATLSYDPLQTEVMNDRIINVFTRGFLEERAGVGYDDLSPVFIVGLPRSGSTLIEQILASHSLVDGTSELHDLGRIAMSTGKFRFDKIDYPEAVRDLEPADFAALGRSYIAATRRHRGTAPFFTDKMPNNFPTIGFLKLILPRAKIIDARRHPMDSCMGSYKQLFAKGQHFTYDLFELAEYYLQYTRMMAHWDAVLPGTVLRVDYEALLADQECETRRILDYCGLKWENACLRFHKTERAVKTASSEQVRRPAYRSSVQSWRKFAPHLRDLERHLASALAALPPHIRDASPDQ